MTPEDKQYRAALSALKRYPLTYDEMFSQKEPLFPIMQLQECYERYCQEHGKDRSSVSHFFYYLIIQEKPEKDIEKELYEKFVYASIDDIMFGVWLGNNSWQPYDGYDRWINLKAGNKVVPITELFADYKTENNKQ